MSNPGAQAVKKYPRRKETLTITLPSICFDTSDEPDELEVQGENASPEPSPCGEFGLSICTATVGSPNSPINTTQAPSSPIAFSPAPFVPAPNLGKPTYYTTISTPSPVRKLMPPAQRNSLNSYQSEIISCGGAKLSLSPVTVAHSSSTSVRDLMGVKSEDKLHSPKLHGSSPSKALRMAMSPPKPVFNSLLSASVDPFVHRLNDKKTFDTPSIRANHPHCRRKRKAVRVQSLVG